MGGGALPSVQCRSSQRTIIPTICCKGAEPFVLPPPKRKLGMSRRIFFAFFGCFFLFDGGFFCFALLFFSLQTHVVWYTRPSSPPKHSHHLTLLLLFGHATVVSLSPQLLLLLLPLLSFHQTVCCPPLPLVFLLLLLLLLFLQTRYTCNVTTKTTQP